MLEPLTNRTNHKSEKWIPYNFPFQETGRKHTYESDKLRIDMLRAKWIRGEIVEDLRERGKNL